MPIKRRGALPELRHDLEAAGAEVRRMPKEPLFSRLATGQHLLVPLIKLSRKTLQLLRVFHTKIRLLPLI